MLRSLFSGKDSQATTKEDGLKPVTLLVLQADDYDWVSILRGAKLRDGRPIRVAQTGWEDINIHCDTYSSSSICVEISKLAKSASSPEGFGPSFGLQKSHTVQPDFVLVRNECKTPAFDGQSRLNGLAFADIPSMNSLESIQMFLQRPAVQGRLYRLQRQLGKDVFPVIDSHFCSTSKTLMYGYTFPAVVKVGSAHAGVGKMQIKDHHQMSDFRSVLAMTPDQSCFVEPFIRGSSDLRIQKIGSHYRAFKRIDISGTWKTNTGTSIMEEIECTDRYKLWADASAEMFGGLDILTVDAIVEEDTGKEYILEVNGTSSGLHPDKADEDNLFIKELLLEKMNAALCSETPLES
eukprot:TRINITY_DN3307_c1_g2_i1.p1 TRINITY_DN3307_c1_g2~~TRINITY_DN3307_c1_g2_i1.p1  ORF type:complete len:350 (+),score=62.01 TRINITY_DN3307_c1_g2_i1:93-1142(+)